MTEPGEVRLSAHWNGDAIWEALGFNPWDSLDDHNMWDSLNPNDHEEIEGEGQ